MTHTRMSRVCVVVAALLAAMGTTSGMLGQSSPPADATHSQHTQHADAPKPDAPPAEPSMKDLIEQLAALRGEVARLQAALAQGHAPSQGMSPPPAPDGMQRRMGMGSMGEAPAMGGGAGGISGRSGPPGESDGGMGMRDMDMKMMGGGMFGGPPAMAGRMGMDQMMKMMGMGEMPMGGAGSPATMSMPSALPGFPGASHIYHIGATGFFLDHSEHITLTLEQQIALNQLKERALLQQADLQRKIAQAEQELWLLTAADQPDAVAIEQKVQEIARKQGEQRLAFIRAVGEAARLLTDEQRQQLAGMLPPAPMTSVPPSPLAPAVPQGGGMDDM